MQKGHHLLVDCRHVAREICLDDGALLEIMVRAAKRAGPTVISQIRYKFGQDSPPGFTCIVMLDESHISAHTYADLGLIAMDVFTCGKTDPNRVLAYIREEVDLGEVTVRDVSRFVLDDQMAEEEEDNVVSIAN